MSVIEALKRKKKERFLVKHPLSQADVSDRVAYAVGIAMAAQADDNMSQQEDDALANLVEALQLSEEHLERVKKSSLNVDEAAIDTVLSVLADTDTKFLFMLDLCIMGYSDGELNVNEHEVADLYADLLGLNQAERAFFLSFASAAKRCDEQAACDALTKAFENGLEPPFSVLLYFLPTLTYRQDIEGFTLEQGQHRSLNRPCRITGPVIVNAGAALEIHDVSVVMGENASIYVNGGQLSLRNSTITSGKGCGSTLIVVTDVPRIQWERVTFDGQHHARAIHVTGGTVTLSNCSFCRCATIEQECGGSIYATKAQMTLTECTFRESLSRICGGALYACEGDVTLAGCTFSACQSFDSGGAVNIHGNAAIRKLDMIGCSFIDCESKINGGAISLSMVMYQIQSGSFQNCSASQMGGAIYKGSGEAPMDVTPKVTACEFSNCVAGQSGNVGGAVDLWYSGCKPIIEECQYTGCQPVDFVIR